MLQDIEQIYKQYSQIVYKYVLGLSNGNKDIAEEITSETFAIAVERINQFKGNCKISVWLCQIAKFLWYKEIKHKTKFKFEQLEDLQLADNENLEDKVIQKQEKLKLFKDIQTLDTSTKDVMYLRVMGNLSCIEIAESIGKTPNLERVTYYRGKEKLKEVSENGDKK